MTLRRISVIVCTCNRSAWVRACLESLLAQDYPDGLYEVIAVDDGSTDETWEILKNLGHGARSSLKIIRQQPQGPAAARNRGAAVATGEVLAFLDDDTVAPANWLSAVNKAFDEHPEAQCIGSHTLLLFTDGALDKRRFWDDAGADAVMPMAFEPQKWLSTHNLAILQDAFQAAGGFSLNSVTQAITGDEDLGFMYRLMQLGFTLLRTGRTVVYHRSRERIADLLRQQYCFGRADVRVFCHYFPGQLVIDFQAGRFLRLKDAYHFRNFPFNGCLRLDFFKGFLVSLALAGWQAWLPLAYLFLLWLGILLKVKKPTFALRLLRTLLARDAGYLAGHIRGSWEFKAFYV